MRCFLPFGRTFPLAFFYFYLFLETFCLFFGCKVVFFCFYFFSFLSFVLRLIYERSLETAEKVCLQKAFALKPFLLFLAADCQSTE